MGCDRGFARYPAGRVLPRLRVYADLYRRVHAAAPVVTPTSPIGRKTPSVAGGTVLEHSDTVLLFFLYGLASFAMGLVIVVELHGASPSKLATSLRSLAAFGLLHGLAQWVVMAHLIKTSGTTVEGGVALRGLFLFFSALSALALLHFGVQLIAETSERFRWMRWLPLGLIGLWLVSFSLPLASSPATAAEEMSAASAELCLDCHWLASPAYVTASRGWLTAVDIGSRYLLFLPGSLLAAVGMARLGRQFRALRLPRMARETSWAAGTFLASAFVVGLVVPPGPYLPASALNYATVTERLGFPPQVLWLVTATALTVFAVRMLSFFDMERRQQLQAAVVEERERIAREMHDGFAQAIGYIGLKSSLAEDLLVQHDVDAAGQAVAAIQNAADEAYRDVRASILALRSSDVSERGLATCLEDYCEKFALDTGIAVATDVAWDPTRCWPLVELQLMRIIQEALANVRKHARAARVQVSLEQASAMCTLAVADDGRGFSLADYAGPSGSRYGLKIMQERAQALGGTLRIDAAPGRGTTVHVTIPLTAGG